MKTFLANCHAFWYITKHKKSLTDLNEMKEKIRRKKAEVRRKTSPNDHCKCCSEVGHLVSWSLYRNFAHRKSDFDYKWKVASVVIIIIVIIIVIVFLERLSMWIMLNWAEQIQIQKYRTHVYKTPKTACVQTFMLKHPTKQYRWV